MYSSYDLEETLKAVRIKESTEYRVAYTIHDIKGRDNQSTYVTADNEEGAKQSLLQMLSDKVHPSRIEVRDIAKRSRLSQLWFAC